MNDTFVLTLSCRNRPGIVATVATHLYQNDANILDAQQFDDPATGRFFMRVVFNFVTATASLDALRHGFAAVGATHGMDWRIRPRSERQRVLVLVSRFDHCLADILYRFRVGELRMTIAGKGARLAVDGQ